MGRNSFLGRFCNTVAEGGRRSANIYFQRPKINLGSVSPKLGAAGAGTGPDLLYCLEINMNSFLNNRGEGGKCIFYICLLQSGKGAGEGPILFSASKNKSWTCSARIGSGGLG